MKQLARALAIGLSLTLAFPPAWALAAVEAAGLAGDQAPEAQVDLLNRLGETGPLEALKPFLKAGMTTGDVTTALCGVYPDIQKIDPKELRPEDKDYPLADWGALLALVREKKGALRAKGLSAWAYEKKLVDVTQALSPKPAAAPVAPKATSVEPTPAPPPPAVSPEEVRALKNRLGELGGRIDQVLQDAEKRRRDEDATEKTRQADREAQKEELRLMKSLLDALQGDLAKVNARLEEVGKKADSKNLTDTELRQNLTLMRKDLRDNVEDVTLLKQKVEKLMAPEKQYAKPLDKALASKWVPGAALLVALGAIVIAVSKK